MTRRIIIKKVEMPPPGSLQRDIDFICKSFGYFSDRDKKGTAGKIFRIIVQKAKDKGLSSEEIARRLRLTRGAIVHHLNSFIESGLIIREGNTYKLRAQSLQKSIDEIKEDIDRMFNELKKIAKEIDERLGNIYR